MTNTTTKQLETYSKLNLKQPLSKSTENWSDYAEKVMMIS